MRDNCLGMKQWIDASKRNAIPKGVFLPFSKLYSILAVANLLAHNNKFYYSVLQLNCSFSDVLTTSGVALILLAMVLRKTRFSDICNAAYLPLYGELQSIWVILMFQSLFMLSILEVSTVRMMGPPPGSTFTYTKKNKTLMNVQKRRF